MYLRYKQCKRCGTYVLAWSRCQCRRRKVDRLAKGKYEEWLTPEGLLKIEGWARDGLIDEQIAAKCNISVSTLNEWKKRFPTVSESLKKGKEVIDRKVENALLKRALGYKYNEVTKELVKNLETGELELKTTKIVTKEVTPDTTAQIFWLKNRKSDDWVNDPQVIKLRKKELELREKQIEENSW